MIGLLTACSSQNDDKATAETSINVDLEDTKDAVKKTFNNAEKEIKEGAEQAKEKLADAGDAIKESYEDTKEKLSDDDGAGIEIEVKKD